MNTRDLVLVALFAAIIVVLGLIPKIDVASVPITAQSMGVMLAGAILGPRRGALAAALVVVLVAIGLPVLAGGRGGLGIFAGPSGGFIFGWMIGAFVTGFIVKNFISDTQTNARAYVIIFLAACLGGIGIVYLFGILWWGKDLEGGFMQAYLTSLVFIPGDLIKAVLTVLITIGVRRAYPLALK